MANSTSNGGSLALGSQLFAHDKLSSQTKGAVARSVTEVDGLPRIKEGCGLGMVANWDAAPLNREYAGELGGGWRSAGRARRRNRQAWLAPKLVLSKPLPATLVKDPRQCRAKAVAVALLAKASIDSLSLTLVMSHLRHWDCHFQHPPPWQSLLSSGSPGRLTC